MRFILTLLPATIPGRMLTAIVIADNLWTAHVVYGGLANETNRLVTCAIKQGPAVYVALSFIWILTIVKAIESLQVLDNQKMIRPRFCQFALGIALIIYLSHYMGARYFLSLHGL